MNTNYNEIINKKLLNKIKNIHIKKVLRNHRRVIQFQLTKKNEERMKKKKTRKLTRFTLTLYIMIITIFNTTNSKSRGCF